MSQLGIRQTDWLAQETEHRRIVKRLLQSLILGDPARYKQPNGTIWFIFDDPRFKPVEVAYMGALFANMNDLPANYTVPQTEGQDDWTKARQQAKAWLENPARTVQLVKNPTIDPDSGVHWMQQVLDANGAPLWVRGGDAVPSNWSVV